MNITDYKYKELKYFCLQYNEKKNKLREITYLSAVVNDGMPHSTNIADPVARKAIEITQLKKEIELIEQVAISTGEHLYQKLLENVTKGTSWEYLDIPISRRMFFRLRHAYFENLAQAKLYI